MDDLLPWQRLTVGSGLLLAAASLITLDPDELRRQTLAAIAATPEAEKHNFAGAPGGWTAISLLSNSGAYGEGRPLRRHDRLDHLPLLERSVLSLPGLMVEGAYILRQPAAGVLAWHYDHQGLHLPLARLLLSVQVPSGAFTWIGHEKHAFPAGTLWTGDFSQPHQVENGTDQDRLMIAVDVTVNDAARALFPAALYAEGARRQYLSQEGINALLVARSG